MVCIWYWIQQKYNWCYESPWNWHSFVALVVWLMVFEVALLCLWCGEWSCNWHSKIGGVANQLRKGIIL